MSRIGKSLEKENRLVISRGLGRREWRATASGINFLFGLMKMFWN
jgi:hypothetical protein